MKALRTPETGCPWDLEQDFTTILPHTLEEAYEVADAIEQNDMAALKDELGDLLFQVIYHSQMAEEKGEFTFDDVVVAVTNKMISRHPHVFGDATANSADDVNEIWEQQKDKEKGHKKTNDTSALSGIARALPALLQAQKLQKKAAKAGFEWRTPEAAFDKYCEELEEFRQAEQSGTKPQQEDELGDILFCLVNYARMCGINAEEAMRKANNKFIKRFNGMEKECCDRDIAFNTLSDEEMLACWKRQK